MKRKDYILFDLDGTLTDPKEGITKSVQHALAHFGIQTDDLDSLTPFIGPPLRDSFKKYYGFSDEQAWEGVQAYREYFSVRGWVQNKEYPGIKEMLEALKEAGRVLLVATSKREKFARKILEHFDMADYFDFIGGADMGETRVRKGDVIRYVLDNAPEEMAFFNQFVDKGLIERLEHVLTSEFGHVTYTEAIEILEKHNDEFEYKVHWGSDLQTEHERYLTEKEFKRPVFVTDYPKEIKAFYMKLNEDGKTVAAMDCLVPGIGEIIGGSQREDKLELLEQRMEELGLNKEDYEFYLDLRRYGSARHAGFGLGFERCVMYLTGMGNIRDVIPFPRTVKNCEL